MAPVSEAPSDAPGLYVHVPFCVSKCRYCGFFSETRLDDRGGWVDAVVQEAASYQDRFEAFDTVYLGGGTPSILSDRQLESLIVGLRRCLRWLPSVEITVELNPGDVNGDRAARWLDMGISRASVGVQSFDDEALRFLERRHDAATAWRVLTELRAAGFKSLGIDLIWGIPGQPVERALESLDRALQLSPEHLSCYELTVEHDTPLHRDVAAGLVIPVPDDESASMAVAFWSKLAEAGYEHYEVSNFARTPSHRSRHNTKYWRHVPYLGLGPSAHSFDGRRRWCNVRSVEGYRSALQAGQTPVEFEELLSPEQMRVERVALGIRTSDGVGGEWVEGDRLDALQNEGLIILRKGRVVPTQRGLLVADALALALLGNENV